MATQVLQVLVQGKNDTHALFGEIQKDAKLSTEQLKALFNAGAADRARLIADFQKTADVTRQSTEETKKWTEAKQRAAQSMSAMHSEALKFNQSLVDGKAATGGFGEELTKMVGLGAALSGGMALAAKGLELVKSATIDSVKSFVEFGTQMDRLHEKLNVPIEIAAAWQQSSAATDVSAQQIVSSLAMMDQRLAEGNKKAIDAVNTLGISLKDLRDATPDKQVEMLSEAFGHLEEKGIKADVIVKELMGRGGLQMLSVFTKDAEDLRLGIEQINGPLGEQVKIAKEYEKNSALLVAHWEAMRRTVTAPLVGGLADLMAMLNRAETARSGTALSLLFGAATGTLGPSLLLSNIRGPKNTGGASGSWTSFGFGPGQTPNEVDTITATDADIEREQRRHETATKKYWADMVDGLKKWNEETRRTLDARTAAEARADKEEEQLIKENTDQFIRDVKRRVEEERKAFKEVADSRKQLLDNGKAWQEQWKKTLHALDIASDITDLVSQIGQAIGGTFGSILDNVTEVFQNFISRVKDGLFDIMEMAQTVYEIGRGGFQLGRKVGSPGRGALAGAGQGALTGAAIGSVVPGIGTAAGAVIGGIAGGIGGFLGGKKGQAEQRAAMEEMRQQMLQTFGGMEALRKKAGELGIDISRAFSTRNPQEFQRIVESLNQGMADQKKRWEGIQTAVGGLDLMVKGFSATMQAHGARTGMAMDVVEEKLARYKKSLEEAGVSEDEVRQRVRQREHQLTDSIRTHTDEQQAAFRRLGDYAAAVFGAMIRETGDVIGALQQMEPTLANLADLQAEFGLAGSEALQQLLGLRQIVVDNADIAQSIQGLNQLMRGLGDAGIATSAMFQAFGQDAAANFAELTARGVDANQAMILMQPSLQQLWEHQQKFHDITDEATLALLEQAETQGLVGENMKSVNEKILDVLLAIAKVLGADIPQALRNLPEGNIVVNVRRNDPENLLGGGPRGGGGPERNIGTEQAWGGYTPYRAGGTWRVWGERTGEYAVPEDAIGQLAAKIAAQNVGSNGGSYQAPPPAVNVYIGGEKLDAVLARRRRGGYDAVVN